tara:strand:- start:161 stop:469 length:309 start_codon:yes stop_codon:yes gene_type:complete
MNKGIVLLGTILALVLFTSCASNHAAIPKAFPGSPEIFNVNNEGTVEVKVDNLTNQPMHWVFVNCNHWSGCYMRCQGPAKTCKSIAKKSGLKISHTMTNKSK